jgi:glyoxylase-like metal-dependent hydrolase (beta-lactamase superfamily II)
MAPKSQIQVDVFIPPLLKTATGSSDPKKQWWSPICCTLVHTPKEAILIDTSPTIDQTNELADWIDQTLTPGSKLLYFFTTHAHGDHFLGFPALQKRYPGIKPIATSKVVQGLQPTYESAALDYWCSLWPDNGMSKEKVTFEPLPESNEINLDGHVLKAYDVTQGDSAANSFLHVPDLALVVAGDLVYGDCYQYLAEANTREKRDNWIKAVEEIEALKPQIVVPGHKRRTQIDGAYLTVATKEYIRVFDEELGKAENAEALEERMRELYPHRWNEFILQRSCVASFANK